MTNHSHLAGEKLEDIEADLDDKGWVSAEEDGDEPPTPHDASTLDVQDPNAKPPSKADVSASIQVVADGQPGSVKAPPPAHTATAPPAKAGGLSSFFQPKRGYTVSRPLVDPEEFANASGGGGAGGAAAGREGEIRTASATTTVVLAPAGSAAAVAAGVPPPAPVRTKAAGASGTGSSAAGTPAVPAPAAAITPRSPFDDASKVPGSFSLVPTAGGKGGSSGGTTNTPSRLNK